LALSWRPRGNSRRWRATNSNLTLLDQNNNCSTCVATALAGSSDSLIELDSQMAGQQTRVMVVSVPSAAGSPRTVLFSELSDAPESISAGDVAPFTDPSGRWVLL
jgi:hypothetical protein